MLNAWLVFLVAIGAFSRSIYSGEPAIAARYVINHDGKEYHYKSTEIEFDYTDFKVVKRRHFLKYAHFFKNLTPARRISIQSEILHIETYNDIPGIGHLKNALENAGIEFYEACNEANKIEFLLSSFIKECEINNE